MRDKLKRKKYNRQYRIKNIDKIKKWHASYYIRHKEEIQQRQASWYLNHKKEQKIRTKKYYLDNKKKLNKINKNYYNKHKERLLIIGKENRLQRVYKISLQDYKNLLISQKNKCAICESTKNNTKYNFYIDHNHETNKIRGLICHNCNCILGYAKDSILILSNAIKYLEKYEIIKESPLQNDDPLITQSS